MIEILLAGFLALMISLLGTPVFIKQLVRSDFGQFIREDGPTSHHTKRGTPTMGGVVIIGSVVLSYALVHLIFQYSVTASGMLLLFLIVGMCAVGFVDDYIKISKQRSLGLTAWAKITGQLAVGTVFAVLALQFRNQSGLTPASTRISFIRDTPFDLAYWGMGIGLVLFVLWSNFMIVAVSNGVNLADGLDGLAAGASALVFGAYLVMSIFQQFQDCSGGQMAPGACYQVRDPQELSLIAAALVGGCVGFLWWNTSPAKIFMGDAGSLSLGAALGGLAILSRTELLLIILGGLFVLITSSVIIQVGYFKATGKRVFKMAPLQHHFELKGWGEVTIVVRFWIITVLFVSVGLGFFFAEWVTLTDLDFSKP